MKRCMLALVTTGMILSGGAIVELLDGTTATPAQSPPARAHTHSDRTRHDPPPEPTNPPSTLADLFAGTYPSATWDDPTPSPTTGPHTNR